MKRKKFELKKVDEKSWAVFKREYLEYWDNLEIAKLEKAWEEALAADSDPKDDEKKKSS
jgi:hypothetical protein